MLQCNAEVYECNNYMDGWSFDNWGIQFWNNPEKLM